MSLYYNKFFEIFPSYSDGILVSHLPDGPTAYFKISNVKLTKDMKVLSFWILYLFSMSFYFYFSIT